MMYSNVIGVITISRRSFVFSQSRVKVSTSLTNIGSLAVGAFDLVDCSLVDREFDARLLVLQKRETLMQQLQG